MLAAKGQSILSWIADDSFEFEGKASTSLEVIFFCFFESFDLKTNKNVPVLLDQENCCVEVSTTVVSIILTRGCHR